MTQKVSIIIPIYNVEPYIEQSLRSAFNQTYDNIEYILVDDCGTDNSMDVACKVAESAEYSGKNVVFIKHKQNRGQSAARNTGLQKATGDYIFFMDSDDEITSNCIELHLNTILRTSADYTVANEKLVGAKSIHIKNIDPICGDMKPEESYFKKMWSLGPWNKLYNANFISCNELKFKEGIIYEDILWLYNVSRKATKLAVLSDATYIYKIRKSSTTTSLNTQRKIESLLYVLSEVNMYDNKEFNNLKDKFLSFWSFNTALLLFNTDCNLNDKKSYYNKIKQYGCRVNSNIYSLILHLPYLIFSICLQPIYRMYKKM